jgi:hypothetical protein
MLDEDRNLAVNRLTLLLTRAEMAELRDSAAGLLAHPEHQHSHVPSEDYQKEVTLVVYDPNDLSGLHERCRRVILKDE